MAILPKAAAGWICTARGVLLGYQPRLFGDLKLSFGAVVRLGPANARSCRVAAQIILSLF